MDISLRQINQSYVVIAIWVLLGGAAALGAYSGQWSLVFVAAITFALTLMPLLIQRYMQVVFPVSFASAIVVFIYGTLFLGEVASFYERLWWWDIALHGGSAVGFGLIGFVLIFMLFEGDRYAAPPVAICGFAFSFAVSVGVVWEVFEYLMDLAFGLNMQKSGLRDTMGDLMVDVAGSLIGAAAGFFYLKGVWFAGLARQIDEFVKLNRRLFRKNKE